MDSNNLIFCVLWILANQKHLRHKQKITRMQRPMQRNSDIRLGSIGRLKCLGHNRLDHSARFKI